MAVTPFDITEGSNQDGAPIRLYEFRRGSQFWRYNTSDRDILRAGQLWLGGAGNTVSDEGIRQSGEAAQDDLKVTVPAVAGIAQLFAVYPPSVQVWLKVLDTHEALSDVVVSWVGTVTDVQRPVPGTAVIVCQNITLSLSRSGLRLSWSRSCPYSLYEPRTCRVNRNEYAVGASVLAVAGGGITISVSFASGYLDGGYIEWLVAEDPLGVEDVMESRGITTQTGQQVQLLNSTRGIQVGQNIVVYPGCARTIQVCDGKFKNSLNYGGIPGLPGKSPFDGNPVF